MEISFLIGAGFSIPEGYPKTEDINGRLRKIDESDIGIYTGGACWFAEKVEEPRYNTGEDTERLFIQEFLKFYNKEILKERFHYEKFFDFYIDLIRGKSSAKITAKFNTFIETFNRKKGVTIFGNSLVNFDNCFNQLLADFFSKEKLEDFEHNTLSKLCEGKYSPFLNLLKSLGSKYKEIHLHSLNHDLLMERLSFCEVMENNFSDGFSEKGSPYHTKNNSQLKIFKDEFGKKFCLYKLHGSLNQYYIDNDNCMVRVKEATYLGKLNIENEEGKNYQYVDDFYKPDFLSGIKEKKRNYKMKCYYKPVFKHFKENLKKSDNLIVIGYSLRDDGINNYIKKYFLSKKDSKMLIIDTKKAKSPIYNYPNVIYYGKGLGVQDIDNERISKLLDLN